MPFTVKCHNCSHVLFQGNPNLTITGRIIRRGFLDHIVDSYGGLCPNCGAKLSREARSVEVKPLKRRKRDE